MGIWKQRIDESWLKCQHKFRIVNAKGGTSPSADATAISLKHNKIDESTFLIGINPVSYRFIPTNPPINNLPSRSGFMQAGIGENSI